MSPISPLRGWLGVGEEPARFCSAAVRVLYTLIRKRV